MFNNQTVLFWNGQLILGMSGPKNCMFDVSPGVTAEENIHLNISLFLQVLILS
jgi:hypothetical protein